MFDVTDGFRLRLQLLVQPNHRSDENHPKRLFRMHQRNAADLGNLACAVRTVETADYLE